MSPTIWLRTILAQTLRPASGGKALATRRVFRPALEALEERWQPSTLRVTNTLDTGTGSLRADIAAAHIGDTIAFAIPTTDPGYNPATGVFTIALSSGELLIKHNLAITGPGADELTISGSNLSRVFEVAKNQTVTLSGLTITEGSAAGTGAPGHGGAIESSGTLTVNGCTLSHNTAFSGGGIYNETPGTLTVRNSTLIGNSTSHSGDGGGIASTGTLTVDGCILSNNSSDGAGGGIECRTMTISNSILTGNSGCGIEYGDMLTVINCTLTGNSGGSGGGIEGGGPLSTLMVSGSKLQGNSAEMGGGICADGTVNVTSSTLTGNSAINWGGAIFIGLGTLVVDGSSFSGNSAFEGGALFVEGGDVTTLTKVTMESNTATGYGSGYGGGIYNIAVAPVSLDAFTLANIINNTDSSGLNGSTANIDGSYTLLN